MFLGQTQKKEPPYLTPLKNLHMTAFKTTLAIFSLFFFGMNQYLSAQITDDFSDGNFTENPAWQGDNNEFIVNPAGELQLNAPDAGASLLAVGGAIPDSAVWLFSVRLEFAPSATNQLRVYLLADQPDLLASNGYYLEIGENGTADALQFFRQDGTTSLLLATGLPGFVANEPVNINVRVKRSNAGNWTIEAAAGNGAFQPQGEVADATYAAGPARFFGLHCVYTATRRDKFFFDNLSILPDVPDLIPPVLLSAQAIDANTVEVSFDEALDAVSALDPVHYMITGTGQPASVSFAGAQAVRLSLSGPLNTGNYNLETNQIADTSGNVSGLQTTGFQFVSVQAAAEFDILINEIMADPSPPAGLPDAEWLELYNRSDKIVDLSTIRLSDGGTPQALPSYLLYPDSFVVLSSAGAAIALTGVAPNLMAVSGFPSLNNDGDPLSLTDAGGTVIDQVTYSANWHTVAGKKEGGWSLERINPATPCLGAENWQSCPVLPGGTPGRINASWSATPDTEGPRLLAVFPESNLSLRVVFAEGLDKNTAGNTSSYQITPSRVIAAAQILPADRREVKLTLADPLQSGIVYAVSATATLTDCSGNQASGMDTVYIGLPEIPQPRDIVINEILFNPATGGSDYIELYNRSNKIFSWTEFSMANLSDGADVEAITHSRLFFPGEYAVFTSNPADIGTRFSNVHADRLFELALPGLPDDAGNITLFWSKAGAMITVDSFDYLDDFHNALLSSAERDGVALERIRPENDTNNPSNWTSAARSQLGGAGTPTLPNSQHPPAGNLSGDDLIQLIPARLSPDDDGFEDFLDIRYALPSAGYAATMTIFDSEGIPIRRLLRQELVGATGALRWDGDMDDGVRARPGIYILFLEIFTPEGQVQRVKKPFALVRRF